MYERGVKFLCLVSVIFTEILPEGVHSLTGRLTELTDRQEGRQGVSQRGQRGRKEGGGRH